MDQDDKVGITTTTHAGRGMQWPIGDHETEQLNAAGDINPISCEPTTGFNGHAGEVLSAPKVFAIYWGRDYGTPAVGLNNTARNFDSFLATVLNSTYMDMLAQYGVGRGTFAGSTWVDHDPGTSQTFTYSGMSELLTNWLNAGLSPIVPAPNEVQLLFVIFASREVTLTDDNGNTGFCGYHSSGFFKIFPWPWTKKNLFFAVIGANGTTDIVAHELAEAATDRSGNGWFSDSTSPCSSMFDHPEIGDVCSACGAPTLRIDGFDVASYWLVDAGRCLQQVTSLPHHRPWVSCRTSAARIRREQDYRPPGRELPSQVQDSAFQKPSIRPAAVGSRHMQRTSFQQEALRPRYVRPWKSRSRCGIQDQLRKRRRAIAVQPHVIASRPVSTPIS